SPLRVPALNQLFLVRLCHKHQWAFLMLILYLFLLANSVFGCSWKLPIINYQLLISNYQKRLIAQKTVNFPYDFENSVQWR
ncbi:MAG: hypothetical protein ACMG55_03830, partial [Microcoleus sp.]